MIQPVQPLDATCMFWKEPLVKIVVKAWQANHFNRVCNTHNSKIEVSEHLILANQPIQPALATHTFKKKNGFHKKLVLRGLAIQPIQPLDATSMLRLMPLEKIVGKE